VNNTNNDSIRSCHKDKFLWTNSKEERLDQKKPCNNTGDKYNTFLNLESKIERLERVILCMRFVVFLWRTD